MSSPDIPSTSAQALAKPDRPRRLPLTVAKPKEKPAYRIRFTPNIYRNCPWRVERRSTFLWIFPSWTDMGGFTSSHSAVEEVTELAARALLAKQALETNKKVLLFDRQGRPIEHE